MPKLLAALSAIVVLTGTASVSKADTLIFQSSGVTDNFNANSLLPGPGKYRMELQTSVPIYMSLTGLWDIHWDVFIAPYPKPHSEYLDGNTRDRWVSTGGVTNYAILNFVIPGQLIEYFEAPEGLYPGVPAGTLLYLEENTIAPRFEAYGYESQDSPFEYSFRVTQIAAIPEPSAWALMILGFGSAGAMLPRRHVPVT